MINNDRLGWLLPLMAAAMLPSCSPKQEHAGALQGVVELDERDLGFEVGGRIVSVDVKRGEAVRRGQVLAALDDTLERTARQGTEAEARAAEAGLALLKAGSRPEEIRSAQAELRAAQANEALLQKNVQRERTLFEHGAVAVASVDDLESRLRAATASRQALEHRVRELQNGARKEDVARAEAQAAAAGEQVKLGGERVLRYTLSAGIDGTVLEVHADPSEIVAAGQPVFTVADTKHPYVDVFVPENQLNGVLLNSAATLVVDNGPPPVRGFVETIAHHTEFTPRYLFSDRERGQLVVRVRVRFADPEETLHAGVPAFVTIERGSSASGAPSR